MTVVTHLFRLSSAGCATSTKEKLLLIYSSGSTVYVERRLPAANWTSSRRYGYIASELLPVFGRFSSGEREKRLKPCLRKDADVCQFFKFFVRPNYQFGEAVHYRHAFMTWLRLLARSVRELRVPIYVIRNPIPTNRHSSFPSCHMILVNPAI